MNRKLLIYNITYKTFIKNIYFSCVLNRMVKKLFSSSIWVMNLFYQMTMFNCLRISNYSIVKSTFHFIFKTFLKL